MLSLRDALESALVEDPDDLATHYAYADYLQEQGDPRGEFIQVQLALEDPQRSETERRRLQTRAKELLREHEREWLGILADDLLPPHELTGWTFSTPEPRPEYHFARGWLDTLLVRDVAGCTGRTGLGSLLRLASGSRLLRRLVLEYDAGLIESLRDAPFLLNLRVFQLGKPESDPSSEIQGVQTSSSLSELAGRLLRIEELRLYARSLETARLFSLPNLSSLRILQVYYSLRYPLEVLAKNSAVSKLTHLLLHPHIYVEPLIDVAGVRAIVHSPHLRSLTHLQLHRSDLGDVGCTEIVTSGILKRLKVLDLRHGEITDAGASILADCPDLQRLEMLDIERNALTQIGIDALRRVLGPALRGDNQQTEAELAQRQYLYEEDLA